MNLSDGFSFMNDGKDFPVFIIGGKRPGNLDEIYSYDSKNVNRTNILLFGNVFDKRTVYKYIDRRKFIEYVKKLNDGFTICFQEPSQWTDPYESRFYEADYSSLNNINFLDGHRKMYACCFAMHIESEPSWKMYVDDNNNNDDRKICIQLKINFKALLDYLNYYIKEKLEGNYMLVAGSVTYKEKSEINKLHRPDKNGNLNSLYFKNFSFTKYLKLLMIKRKAYIYEDEIRLFLIPTKDEVIKDRIIIQIPAECPPSVKAKDKWGKIIDMLYLDPNSKDEELDSYIKQFENVNIGIDNNQFDISDLNDSFSYIKIGETKEEEKNRKEKEKNELLEKLKKKYEKGLKASI